MGCLCRLHLLRLKASAFYFAQSVYMYDVAVASKQAKQLWFQARLLLLTAIALVVRQSQCYSHCPLRVKENSFPWLLAASLSFPA